MKDRTECDHDYPRTKWVYREYDDSMWDVTTCSNCEGAVGNVQNTEYDYKEYAPGFNRETDN